MAMTGVGGPLLAIGAAAGAAAVLVACWPHTPSLESLWALGSLSWRKLVAQGALVLLALLLALEYMRGLLQRFAKGQPPKGRPVGSAPSLREIEVEEREATRRLEQQEQLQAGAQAKAAKRLQKAAVEAAEKYAELDHRRGWSAGPSWTLGTSDGDAAKEAAAVQSFEASGVREDPPPHRRHWLDKERKLKAIQDAEIAAALAKDRKEEEAKRAAEAEACRSEAERANEVARWEARKARTREALQQEPQPGVEGRIVVAVRLRSSRLVRRAWLETDTLQSVYNWVDSLEEMKLRPNQYMLVMSYPRICLQREFYCGCTLNKPPFCSLQLLLAVESIDDEGRGEGSGDRQ